MSSSKCKRRNSLSCSANLIACNADLLVQIFLCLPAKVVLSLQTVNKQWHSLISSPDFRRIHCRHNFNFNPSGLFIYDAFNPNRSKSVFFDSHGHPMASSSSSIFPPKHGGSILQSCNGLFLYYSGSILKSRSTKFYVGNPTTKQSALLPSPEGIEIVTCFTLSLAFDPSLSPHYKVVYLWWSESSREFHSHVYSSETRRWKSSNHVASAGNCGSGYFGRGVYCNGAIHWMHGSNGHVYYNINDDCLHTMSFPSRHTELESMAMYTVPVAIRNNLFFIDNIYYDYHELVVFELNKDYLGFIEKYRVHLREVLSPFPHINPLHYLLVSAYQGVEEEDIVIVLSMKDVVVGHHTKDYSTEVLLELHSKAKRKPVRRPVIYVYTESLCPV